MASIDIKNWNNETVRELVLPDEVFAAPIKDHLIHEVVVAQRNGWRAGTHKTKVRSEVAGSGRKLWKQKHTGRARVGSIRSPLWRSGGTIHGPQPRSYEQKVNTKIKKAALRSALSKKMAEAKIIIMDRMVPEEAKTKWLASRLAGLGVDGRALLVDSGENRDLILASRNNPKVEMTDSNRVLVYDVMRAEYLIVSETALDHLLEVLQ